jgi:hypothetical protein
MRTTFVSVVLLSVLALSFAQWELPANVSAEYKIPYFGSPLSTVFEISKGNLLLASPSQPWALWTFTGHSFVEGQLTTSCSDQGDSSNTLWVNSKGEYFCAKYDNNTINQVDPTSKFDIENSYEYNDNITKYEFNNDFIILSTDTGDAGTTYNVFDTVAGDFVCDVDISDTDKYYVSSFIAIDDYVFFATNTDTDTFNYTAVKCADGTNVTIQQVFDVTPSASAFRALNGSSVILNIVRSASAYYLVAFSYDDEATDDEFKVGDITTLNADSNIINTGFNQQFNDTHVILAYQDGTGANYVGLFYVDTDLNVIEAASLNLEGYAASVTGLVLTHGGDGLFINFNSVPPRGDSQAAVTTTNLFVNGSNLVVDGAEPYLPYFNYPPVQLKNKQWIELHLLGQSSSNGTFYPYPVWDYYVSPADDDIIWGMYTPAYYNIDGLDDCYLVQIQISTSNVSKISLGTECPCGGVGNGDGYWFSLGDVFVDTHGGYNVAYRCSVNYYGIVSGGDSYTIEDDDLSFESPDPLLLPTYQKDILNVVDLSTLGNVVLKTFNITSGDKINTVILASSGNNNQTAAKVTNDLFVFSAKKTSNAITPLNLYQISAQDSIFNFLLPTNSLDGVIPLAYDPNTFPYVFLYATSFASQTPYVFTPQSEATNVNLVIGSVNLQYLNNETFFYTETDEWIGEVDVYSAEPNFFVPIFGGILGLAKVLLAAFVVALLF